jgi:hypothetical protein
MSEILLHSKIEIQNRDIAIFKYLRDHRALSNTQIQKAFWAGRNIRAVDFRLAKLVEHEYIYHMKFESLQPSNYYFLARKGFNILLEKGFTFKGERLYRPENYNVSGFFQRRAIIADIRIALKKHYGKKLTDWLPDFEIEAKRQAVGVHTEDPKILAAVIPDGALEFRGPAEDSSSLSLFRYHHFTPKREEFTERLKLFEPIWTDGKKLVMAHSEEDISNLGDWYWQD